MGKAELVKAVMAVGITEKLARAAVEAVFEEISEEVKRGGAVEVRGFGTFYLKETAAKVGRNPATQEPINIKASKRLAFRTRLKIE
jgi:nucleoid DNA-binding protein